MAGTNILLICLSTLALFNILFFLAGYNANLFSVSTIISILLTLGIGAVVLSSIPTASNGGAVQWILSALLFISLFYQVDFTIMGRPYSVGIGLVTNLTNHFSASPTELSFMPFLFFHVLGFVGVITGIMSASGGD